MSPSCRADCREPRGHARSLRTRRDTVRGRRRGLLASTVRRTLRGLANWRCWLCGLMQFFTGSADGDRTALDDDAVGRWRDVGQIVSDDHRGRRARRSPDRRAASRVDGASPSCGGLGARRASSTTPSPGRNGFTKTGTIDLVGVDEADRRSSAGSPPASASRSPAATATARSTTARGSATFDVLARQTSPSRVR